jgi:hypothetical protein
MERASCAFVQPSIVAAASGKRYPYTPGSGIGTGVIDGTGDWPGAEALKAQRSASVATRPRVESDRLIGFASSVAIGMDSLYPNHCSRQARSFT